MVIASNTLNNLGFYLGRSTQDRIGSVAPKQWVDRWVEGAGCKWFCVYVCVVQRGLGCGCSGVRGVRGCGVCSVRGCVV